MENNGKSGSFSGAFDRLVCEDDGSVDEDFLYSNQEKQQGIADGKLLSFRYIDRTSLIPRKFPLGN